jgi:hypothetical protein
MLGASDWLRPNHDLIEEPSNNNPACDLGSAGPRVMLAYRIIRGILEGKWCNSGRTQLPNLDIRIEPPSGKLLDYSEKYSVLHLSDRKG